MEGVMLNIDSEASFTSSEITFKGALILDDSSQFYFSACSDATRDGSCYNSKDLDCSLLSPDAEDEEAVGISVPELKTHSADCLSSTKTFTAVTEDSQLHSARVLPAACHLAEVPSMAETTWSSSQDSKVVTALRRIIQANSGLVLKVCKPLPAKSESLWCCR
jgi:hypothetical protein